MLLTFQKKTIFSTLQNKCPLFPPCFEEELFFQVQWSKQDSLLSLKKRIPGLVFSAFVLSHSSFEIIFEGIKISKDFSPSWDNKKKGTRTPYFLKVHKMNLNIRFLFLCVKTQSVEAALKTCQKTFLRLKHQVQWSLPFKYVWQPALFLWLRQKTDFYDYQTLKTP